MVNTTLLRQTLAHILRHPEGWRQSTWRCGTTACFAGWAAILAGGRWLLEVDDGTPAALYLVAAEEEIREGLALEHVLPGGDIGRGVFVADRAQRVLGLTADQRTRLFASTNDLSRLHVIVSQLCEEAAA
ncbi:hypothetical protein [Thermoactinospora rubra]|uniref:hypothetical protein n=1 Tax=Thermoactinospora rubra TaxID=1088767 RepID=UPI000A1069AF|nr:hypothetical protein [Thermoactinospora rubra]